MAARATGTLICSCMIWLFLLCATIAFLQLKLVDDSSSHQASSNRKITTHHSTTDDPDGENLEGVTHKVYFDVQIGGKLAGRIVMGLFWEYSSENCRKLQSSLHWREGGLEKVGSLFAIKGAYSIGIIPSFMVQGGDFTRGDGRGGESIYGDKFADENFKVKHDGPGYLSMANSGQDTNGSQFFITTVRTSWSDGRHVVFGKVLSRMDILYKIEAEGIESGTPKSKVVIIDSGELTS